MPGFWKKHGALVAVGGAVLVGGYFLLASSSSGSGAPAASRIPSRGLSLGAGIGQGGFQPRGGGGGGGALQKILSKLNARGGKAAGGGGKTAGGGGGTTSPTPTWTTGQAKAAVKQLGFSWGKTTRAQLQRIEATYPGGPPQVATKDHAAIGRH